jgi:arylsulfatase A-like enzyme
MIETSLKSLLCGTILVMYSCFGIQVRENPIAIHPDPTLHTGKRDYLKQIAALTREDSLPSILVILADDLGKYDISTYNPEGVHTPAIDQLASQGIRFTRAYATSSVCSPSRVSMLTGRYQQRFGYERQPMNRYARNRLEYWFVDHFIDTYPMQLNGIMSSPPENEIEMQGIPESEILLSELLKKRGYRTAIYGKWHLGQHKQFLPTNRGFDEQYGFYEAFTLFAPEDDPDIVNYRHDYYANKHIWSQGREGSCAIRENEQVIEENEYLTFAIANRVCNFLDHKGDDPFFLYVPFSAPHTPFQVPRAYYDRFSHISDNNKRVYYGMISALDDAIAQITAKLEELNLTRRTLIIFASDNGGATYTGATDNGILNGGKFTQFEGGINIPMIVSGMGFLPEGRDIDYPVSLMDIFTTAASVAGCELPADRPYDGIDLIPYLTDQGKAFQSREFIWRTDYNYALVFENWKFIWNTRDQQEYLFNLDKDPGERNNLSEEYPEKAQSYKDKILDWSREMKEPLWPGLMDFIFDNEGKLTLWAI